MNLPWWKKPLFLGILAAVVTTAAPLLCGLIAVPGGSGVCTGIALGINSAFQENARLASVSTPCANDCAPTVGKEYRITYGDGGTCLCPEVK